MDFLTKRADIIKSIKIEQIIDRNYSSVSILEDMQEIAGWLKECRYLALMRSLKRWASLPVVMLLTILSIRLSIVIF